MATIAQWDVLSRLASYRGALGQMLTEFVNTASINGVSSWQFGFTKKLPARWEVVARSPEEHGAIVASRG
jgi:hypothetical protein